MALITCPECGKEISDKAEICVHCGFPIKEYLSKESYEPDIYNSDTPDSVIADVSEDPKAKIIQAFLNFLADHEYWEKSRNLDVFFDDLYACAYSLSAANYYFDGPYFRYTLYLFAVWDICLCEIHSYNKYASKDWVRNNAEWIAEKHSRDSVTSDEIVAQYNRYRYETIKHHDIVDRNTYKSAQDRGVTVLTRLDEYADDLLNEFFRVIVENAKYSSNEELKAAAQIFIIDIRAYLSRVYDIFSKLKLIDDYKRTEPPKLSDYNLPENIETLYKQAQTESNQHFATKRALAKTPAALIIAAIVAFTIYKSDWIWLMLAWFPAIWFFLAGQYTDYEKWKYIDDKGGVYKDYHRYLEDRKKYEEWYS